MLTSAHVVRRSRIITTPTLRRLGVRPRILRWPKQRYCASCRQRITGMSCDFSAFGIGGLYHINGTCERTALRTRHRPI